MNTTTDTGTDTGTGSAKKTLTRKRVWIPAVATVAVLGLGGAGVAYAATGDTGPLTGDDRDRVGAAAIDAVGGGEVLEAETSDDRGEAYEVDVLDASGVTWSISLDEDLAVVQRERDEDGWDDEQVDTDVTGRDADDVPVTGGERERVAAAAVEEIGSGEATAVERSDDPDEAFEVEVVKDDGTVWDVTLDDRLTVLDSRQDR